MGKATGYSYLPRLFEDPKTHVITEIYQPMVAIRIQKGHGQISPFFDALIDSGSDRNLFPLKLATYLGIEFKKEKSRRIYGIGEGYINAYTAKICIYLGTKRYETDADFSSKQNVPILGRDGFFNLFKSIRFDEKGQFVYIEE